MDEVQDAIYRLVQQFVERQMIVRDAIAELRPSYLGLKLPHGRPSIGFWGENNEWKYIVHGVGCKLVHRNTGEPIEWDTPHLEIFDRYWFVNWFVWIMNAQRDNVDVASLSSIVVKIQRDELEKFVYRHIDEIKFIEALDYPFSNKYRLLPDEGLG
jgi:hypothetical protein